MLGLGGRDLLAGSRALLAGCRVGLIRSEGTRPRGRGAESGRGKGGGRYLGRSR